MRSDWSLHIAAVVAILSIVFLSYGEISGAFVGTTNVRIVTEQDPLLTPNVCGDVAQCMGCSTGLQRVALYENQRWTYQFMRLPESLGGHSLGNCCSEGTTLGLSALDNGVQRPLSLSCSRGQWSGVLY